MSSEKKRSPIKAPSGLKERLGWLIEDRGLTQTAFAESLGTKQGVVSGWLSGRHAPSRAIITLICSRWLVNEKWLTEGLGPIYKEGGEGLIGEQSAAYSKKAQRLMASVRELLDLADELGDKIASQHLERQVDLWIRDLKNRKGKETKED